MNILPEIKDKIEIPFRDKYVETCLIIQKRLSLLNKNVAVAWSGGKDSTLVLWLVRSVYPDVPTIFNNTGVEYPETVRFVHQLANDWNLNLIETKPVKTFWQCVEEYGFAGSKSGLHRKDDHCCYYCKEKPALIQYRLLGLRGIFTGTTATENRNRMFHARKGTCYQLKVEGYWKIHPILWWTENEVRQYITDNDIPLNPIYLKGAERCGCMPCTAFKSWEVQLSQTNPKMYAYIKKLKDKQYVMGGIHE